MPGILVGTWDGGSNANDAKVTFFADDDLYIAYNNGQTIYATVVVRKQSMTMYLPGGRDKR